MISVFLPPAASSEINLELIAQVLQDDQLQSLALTEVKARLNAPWQLILPVEAATCCAVQLPSTRKRWLQQALPFAVEEALAEDVEQMHLALGPVLEDGKHRVIAVQRNWLKAWLEALGGAPEAIWVDADLLPAQGTQLCWVQQRWLLSGQDAARVAISSQDWPLIQDLCALPVMAYAPEPQTLAGVEAVIALAEPERFLAANPGQCNLAQGEFAKARQTPLHAWLKPVGLAVAACVVLQVGFNWAQSAYFNQAADQYAADSTALYRTLFPMDTRIVNLRAQFDQHLTQGLLQQHNVLALLNRLAAGAPESLRIEQLKYRQAEAELEIRMLAPSLYALEQAQANWQAAGLQVSLGSTQQGPSGVSANIVIGG